MKKFKRNLIYKNFEIAFKTQTLLLRFNYLIVSSIFSITLKKIFYIKQIYLFQYYFLDLNIYKEIILFLLICI